MSVMGNTGMPSDARQRPPSPFDRFAGAVTRFVSRGTFFSMCLAMVVVWVPSYFLFDSVDSWQMVINTSTTILTCLLVALLQNSQQRADAALQHKLNAIAAALADVMSDVDPADAESRHELRQAIGLEDREGS